MRKFIYATICIIMMLTSCSKNRPEEADITILFTTDVHGLILPYDFLTDEQPKSSMARVYAYVEGLRKEDKECILLDAGDLSEGQPSTYYYNNVATKEKHIVGRAVNFMGYDAVGIGENDIQFGEKIYKDQMPKWFDAPLMCANAYDVRTGEPMFVPYTIVKRQGIKVAVIAMASPDMRIWLTPMAYENIDFRDLEWTAKTWLQIIKEKENPDLIVGIFHVNPELSKEFIAKTSGFDIIFCGQDHTTNCDYITDKEGKKVYFLQPLSHCEEIGEARVHFSRNIDGKYDKKIEIERVDMVGRKPSKAFISEFIEEVNVINDYLDKPLGSLTGELCPIDGIIGPSAIVNVIHDMQLWVTGADISLTNYLSTFINVPAGPISMRDLFNIYKYENQIWTLQMTGEEIHKFLEHAYAVQYNQMTGPDDNLLAYKLDENGEIVVNNFGPEFKTQQYNFASAAGIDYIVDVSKPEGQRVEIIGLSDGDNFDPKEIYRVAMPDHIAVGGGGHTYEGVGWNDNIALSRVMEYIPNDIRVNFSNYIKMRARITPATEFNWKVVPEEWYAIAAPREKEYLEQYLKK